MVIQVENLVKAYKVADLEIKALDGVSFSIKKGDMVAITGSSGSGKSTLMNILGCLDKPDSGSYRLADKKVSELSGDQLAEIRSKMIGFVFQNFNLLPRMNALENVELPMFYAGATNIREKAKKALENVGLGERMYHEPNQLSGGQKQRVAIARAIVNDPAMILADEPTGALDSKTSVEIMNIFLELNKKGRTIIIVTHEHEIADYCKTKISMRDGKILEIKC